MIRPIWAVAPLDLGPSRQEKSVDTAICQAMNARHQRRIPGSCSPEGLCVALMGFAGDRLFIPQNHTKIRRNAPESVKNIVLGADERTRTSMELPPLVPETSASTIPPHPHVNLT